MILGRTDEVKTTLDVYELGEILKILWITILVKKWSWSTVFII